MTYRAHNTIKSFLRARESDQRLEFKNGFPSYGSNLCNFIEEHSATHHPLLTADHYGEPVNLIPYQHEPLDLALALERFAVNKFATRAADGKFDRKKCLSDRQKKALASWQGLEKDPQRLNGIETRRVILEYVKIFYDLFFFGALSDLVCVSVRRDLRPGEAGILGKTILYYNTEFKQIPSTAAILILILDRRILDRNESREGALEKYFGTILHEMLHSFMGTYSCQCVQENCFKNFKENADGRRHGTAWQIGASAIEEFAEEILGRKISLTGANSYAYDCVIGGVPLPDKKSETWRNSKLKYKEVKILYEGWQLERGVGVARSYRALKLRRSRQKGRRKKALNA